MESSMKKEIDPYILEHGGRRARRQAEKEGGPVSG
jgi:Fe-S cluster biogenesis protein NfuA